MGDGELTWRVECTAKPLWKAELEDNQTRETSTRLGTPERKRQLHHTWADQPGRMQSSPLPRIPVLMLAEIFEDEIVTRELLPVNPAGAGLLKVNVAGGARDV